MAGLLQLEKHRDIAPGLQTETNPNEHGRNGHRGPKIWHAIKRNPNFPTWIYSTVVAVQIILSEQRRSLSNTAVVLYDYT